MLDGQAYRAHFREDPAYDGPGRVETPRPLESAELRAALAALETEVRSILKAAAAD